jgi:hypothetical protein
MRVLSLSSEKEDQGLIAELGDDG